MTSDIPLEAKEILLFCIGSHPRWIVISGMFLLSLPSNNILECFHPNMAPIKRYLKIVRIITSNKYPYSQINLLYGYLKLVSHSIMRHKIFRKKEIYRERILG